MEILRMEVPTDSRQAHILHLMYRWSSLVYGCYNRELVLPRATGLVITVN